jgi:hypothetical protein
MMRNRIVRIGILLGMIAFMCGTVSASLGIIAETRETSAGAPPDCTAPCECIAESTAAMRWGADGYERCSKTICGQSATATVQYYCFRQSEGMVSVSGTCPDPCECLVTSAAAAKWGPEGYVQCGTMQCGRDETSGGVVPRACYRQSGSTVMSPTATTASMEALQEAMKIPGTAAAGASVPASPAAAGIPTKSPVGPATILAAIGTAVLAAAGMRRK